MLKILQCLGWYPPDSYGGTERYVEGLVRELGLRGVTSEVMAARDGDSVIQYVHNGCPVTRYPVPLSRCREQLRGSMPHSRFNEFKNLLVAKKPDIYHQHSWTLGCGLHHLRLAQTMGASTVVTIHVPGNICANGTMMYDGKPCDGFIDSKRCSVCKLKKIGLSEQAAKLSAILPASLSRQFACLPGAFGTVLGMRSLIDSHRQALTEACQLADKVIVVAEWLRQALLVNGVSEDRVVLCRHGLDAVPHQLPHPRRCKGTLRIGYLGRWDPVKGVDLLVRSIRNLDRSIGVELYIRALAQGEEGERYRLEVARQAEGDPRIKFLLPLEPEEVSGFLKDIDVLAVPSRCLETGPLVVVEALAAGTPVLGSALGGIKEWVTDGVNGWLVAHDDVNAWSAAIIRMAHVRPELAVEAPIRTMSDVASEMREIYLNLIQEKAAA